jgi:hypothetical protein
VRDGLRPAQEMACQPIGVRIVHRKLL